MSFSLDIAKFAEKAGNNAALVVKKVAVDMSSRIVYRTPVDTGRARGNWMVTFDTPMDGTTTATDKTGQSTVSANTSKIGTWKDGTIWIANNLPYIGRLEYGWSDQAPSGMARVTIREFQGYVAQAVKGLK